MASFIPWLYILGALVVAISANSISAIWAEQKEKLSWWLLAVIVISPLVFITFGLVTARVGVAVGAGTLDSLLSLSTIIVGLLFFKDHKQFSAYQYWGLAFISAGIILMQFSH